MGVPATTGQLRTKVSEMEIGDYITALYGVTGNKVSRLGDVPGVEMGFTGINAGLNWFYFVKAAKGLLIADRVCHHSISWDSLNTAKKVQGSSWNDGNIIPAMTSNTSPSGIASSSSDSGVNYQAWRAFKGNNSGNPWLTKDGTPVGWLKYQFVNEVAVSGYAIVCPSTFHKNMPNSWKFEGSNDNVNWITLDTIAGETGWTQNDIRYFNLPNKDKYLYYRLYINTNNGANYSGVGELHLFEKVGGTIRSLTGGVAYADANGNSSLTDKGFGMFPTNNEFDRLLIGFDDSFIQAGKTLDDVFHHVGILSWTQDTPVNGRFVNVFDSSYVDANNTRRVNRGISPYEGWGTIGLSASSQSSTNLGFRPVFEYKES